jgi:hypothetical protein
MEDNNKETPRLETLEDLEFELIDVIKIGRDKETLVYERDDGGYITRLTFNSMFNAVQFKEWERYNDNKPQGGVRIHSDLFDAIARKREELGWNKDKED